MGALFVHADGQQTVLKVSDIVERLVHLGLDEGEARAFVHLSMTGPSKASDLALSLQIHRTDAYRTLQRLVERGFATASLDRPVVFEATPPETVFQKLLHDHTSKLASIERARVDIAPALVTLRAEPTESLGRGTFRIVKGRPEILKTMIRMIEGAERVVHNVNTIPTTAASNESSGMWEAAARRARAGFPMWGVVRFTPEVQERARAAYGDVSGFHIRQTDEERPVRFFIVDDRELLMLVVNDPSARLTADGDVAIWTEAQDFVGAQRTLFDALWANARPLIG